MVEKRAEATHRPQEVTRSLFIVIPEDAELSAAAWTTSD